MHNTEELLQQLEELPVVTERTAKTISDWIRGARVFFEQGIKEHTKLRDEHTDLQNKFRTLCEEHEQLKNQFEYHEKQSRKRERQDDRAIEYLSNKIQATDRQVLKNKARSKAALKEARSNRTTSSGSTSPRPLRIPTPYPVRRLSPQLPPWTTPDPPSHYPTFVQGSSSRPLIIEEEEITGSRDTPIVIQ